jgi:excisionase family DNA binding protein
VNEQPEELLMEEVMARLRKTKRYVTSLIKRGKLPARKEGREWRVRKSDLDAYIESTRYKPPDTT